MRRRHVIALLVLLFGFQIVRTYAQVTATWTDSTGNWSNPANWSTNTVPNNSGGTTYDVVVNGTGSDTVTYDVNSTVINGLAIGPSETLQNTGSSQTLTTGNVANYGIIDWYNGSKLSFGSLSMFSFSHPGAVGVFSGSTLSATSVHDGVLYFDHSTLNLTGDYSGYRGELQLRYGSSGTITGSIISANGGQTFQLAVNKSTLFVGGDVTSLNGSVTNYSTLTVNGNFLVGNSFTGFTLQESKAIIGGKLDTNSVSTVTIDASTLTADNLYSITQVFIKNGSTVNLKNLNVAYGDFGVDGSSSLNISNDFSNSNDHINIDGVLNVHGTLTNYVGGDLHMGTASILRAGTYNQSGGSTTIESGGKLTTDSFNVTGGTVTVNGTLASGAVNFGSNAALQGTGTSVGNVITTGTLTPGLLGAPGTFTISGNYQQLDKGTLVDLMSPLSQSLLNVTGNVVLGPPSILQINLLNGFNPFGQTFDVMNYSSLSGQFGNGSFFAEDGYGWTVTYGQNEIEVTAGPMPEPSSFLFLGLGLLALVAILFRKGSFGSARISGAIA